MTHESVVELQYADDAALLSCSVGGIQRSGSVLEAEYRRAGLVINTNKTEVMPMAGGTVEPLAVNINGANLRNVHSFCYLGSTFNSSGNIKEEVQRMIGLAAASFAKLSARVFRCRDLSVPTKF